MLEALLVFKGGDIVVFAYTNALDADLSYKMEGMDGKNDKNITRVLFCGPYFPPSHNYTKEYLKNYPFIQVDDVPLDDVPNVIQNYHLCVVKSMRLDSNVISRAKKMKLIMQFGVGLEGVDIDAATECGIKVARIPSDMTGNAASCAEMAIYLILGLLRKQTEMQIAIKQRRLGEPIGQTLLGKTVFIMGFGNIGIDLAKRLRPFGVKIIATKRSWASHSQVSCHPTVKNGVTDDLVDEKGCHEDIYEFAGNADIVVCCLNLNKETAGIINKPFLSSMKKEASSLHAILINRGFPGCFGGHFNLESMLHFDLLDKALWMYNEPGLLPFTCCQQFGSSQDSFLVNIARGGLLDYEAVVHYLTNGHLGGLGMDVAWTEPFNPEDPILKFNNVLITPHVAGVTEHSYRSMAKVVGDVALQLHAGTSLTEIEIVN
ncbi:hypothetical protein Pint_07289 [Pistacia integerrima]|uniref:Uncharacterized protein n=1 Tax=Pistacia integerrima TaxID=434235 RepID=A0ACC0XRJ4_9ROSI|nr:hypothetical protein Pint_07289 [Pistacia integerrima]